MLSQTWNRYSYVSNRPLTFVDPSGFNTCEPGDSALCNEIPSGLPEDVLESQGLYSGPSEIIVTASALTWQEALTWQDWLDFALGGARISGPWAENPWQPGGGGGSGSMQTVTVTATRFNCTPPPMTTAAERNYDPSDPATHLYGVRSLAGYNLSPAQRQALFNKWRNGPNAAPGIAVNTPDLKPVLLAHWPGTPDTNWAYLRTNSAGLSWTNVTLPGHWFDPGKVVNSVVTDSFGFTWLQTVGTGATDRSLYNDVLGSIFFKESQWRAINSFYGLPVTGRFGASGSCN